MNPQTVFVDYDPPAFVVVDGVEEEGQLGSDNKGPLQVFIGDDIVQQIQVRKNGLPVDLSDALDVMVTLQNVPGSEAPNQLFKYGAGVALENGPLGLVTLTVTATQSADLNPVAMQDFDVVVKDEDGFLQTYRFSSGFTALARSVA